MDTTERIASGGDDSAKRERAPDRAHAITDRENQNIGVAQDAANRSGDEIDLRNLLTTLWRRKMMIISTTLLITSIAALTVLQITPLYTATANVMLETRQNKTVDIESVMSGVSADMSTVLSEVEVIRSTSLVRRVVKKLGLVRDPEFNPNLKDAPWYADAINLEKYISRDFLVGAGLRKPKVEVSENEAEETLESEVVEVFRSRMQVTPVRRSLVISISFTSENPNKAALIVNTLSDNYIVDQLEVKFEATKRATMWLNDRIKSLRDKLQNSEQALEAYRAEISNKFGQGSKLTDQQISELNTQIILAQAKQAEAKARLGQVERMLKTQGDLFSSAEVLSSPLINSFREQEAQVLRKVSEMESRYGVRHPNMIKAKAELADLRVSIEREVKKIAQSLRNEVEVERSRATTLETSLDKLENKSSGQGRAEIRLRELERDANANRLLYENFLSRFKETSEQSDLQQADARVISKADVPLFPSFPKKKLTILLAAVGSMFLGVVLVFAMERLDNSFRTPEQIEQLTGIPAIGMIPLVEGGLSERRLISEYLIKNKTSSIAESIRSLKTSLVLSDVDSPPKVIGVTSTVPSEGKSTLALWMAQMAAQSGLNAILVDCDLRRPSVHKAAGIRNDLSIVEVLAGHCALKDAIQRDAASGIYLLPAKVTNANALDLLSSKHMKDSMDALRNNFDLVFIDAPPVLAVSDARVTGQLVDKMLYIIKWDSTPRDLVQTGIRVAKDAHLDLAGVVLTQVNLKKHARYGYGDYGYYYGKYKDYYTS